MVATQKALDALKTIGLNKYERNLWVALLSRSTSTAGELSDISNVPRSRCYDVLDSLAERGFVVVQPGKPLKYVAIHPKEALERAKKKISEHAIELGEKIERFGKSDSLKELERLFRENIKTMQPEDMTGALKGRYALHQQLNTMFKKAKKSVKLMTTESGLLEVLENHSNALKKASEAGVKIYIAAPVGKNIEAAKTLSKYAQIKDLSTVEKAEKIAGRMCIIDNEELLLGLTDDVKTHPTQDVAFWSVSQHTAANMFEPIFNTAWNNSKDFKVLDR